jgi:mannan endo-1,4-beta-mannosidase
MTETGYQVTPTNPPIAGWFSNHLYSALTNNNVEVAFVMFSVNGGDSYFVPGPTSSNAQDFIDFTNKPKALLQNEIPNMYVIPN